MSADVNRIKAEAIKKVFAVFGQFVTLPLGGVVTELRPVLELIRQDRVPESPDRIGLMLPDVLVIMMNPGSSRPLDRHYRSQDVVRAQDVDPLGRLTPTRPDNTQYQIMRVMLARGLGHARVLNLSDLRETKSPIFIQRYQALERLPDGSAHSLFSPLRTEERRVRMGYDANIPLLVGWGRHPGLLPLAKQCLATLEMNRMIGLEIPGQPGLYAHPSPMLQKAKEAWVDAVLARLL